MKTSRHTLPLWLRQVALAAMAAFGVLTLLASGGGGGAAAPPVASSSGSISGQLSVASFNAVDSDVNNPDDAFAPNNSCVAAQNLPNPVLLGGYVTATPTGFTGGPNTPADRFALTADPKDYFLVTLAAGQVITLQVSEHAGSGSQFGNPDLNLFLWTSDGLTLVGSSSGTGPSESVSPPASGVYCIEVRALDDTSPTDRDASVYNLSIGIVPTEATVDTSGEFIPGEILVTFRTAAGTTLAAAAANATQSLQGLGLRLKKSGGGGQSAGPFLFEFDPAMGGAQTLQSLGAGHGAKQPGGYSVRSPLADDTVKAVEALRKRADVRMADLNYIRRPLATPNDPRYVSQWHYPMINLPQAWDITSLAGGNGVIVAVVDTGVLVSHPDFAGRLMVGANGKTVADINGPDGTNGYDFISNTANANDGDGPDNNPDDPGDGALGGSSSFHGTHVAGTVAAATHNGIGVAGVAGGARIMPLRVLGVNGGSSLDIIAALRYAAGLSNASGKLPLQKADIINLSLGGGGFSQNEQGVYNDVRNAGVIVIAASGNSNSNAPSYPAAYDNVMSVGSVGPGKARAPYSNFGTTLDLVAPGGDTTLDLNHDGNPDGVLSTHATDGQPQNVATYNFLQGTSMAAPHMAGVAALMKSVYPGLTPIVLDNEIALGNLTESLGGSPAGTRNDTYGYGLIDALKAVERAQALAGGAPSPALLTVSPASLDFGSSTTVLMLTAAQSAGSGTVTLNSVSDTAPWLTVTGSGLGPYTVTADRSGLADGVYSATITFAGNTNTVPVPVALQVGTSVGGFSAGAQYVLAFQPDLPPGALHPAILVPSGGQALPYSLGALAPADYYAITGSDPNNDGFVCGPGESCGAWPILTSPILLTVDNNAHPNTNFTTGYNAGVAGQSAEYPLTGASGNPNGFRGYRRGLAPHPATKRLLSR